MPNTRQSTGKLWSPLCAAMLSVIIFASNALAQSTIEIPDALVTVIEQVRVPALKDGSIIELNVAEGDIVEAGQVLGRIDDREPRLALSRAKAELETAIKAAESQLEIRLARKKFELAQSDLRRVEKARSMMSGSIADEEYENRRLQVQRTQLEIDKSIEDRENAIAQAKLLANDYRRAELAIKLTQIVSPISGAVVSIERQEGEWANTGETILELLGTAKLRAEAMVDASKIGGPIVGRRVVLLVNMPSGSTEKFKGIVRFENPEINPLDNRVNVWAEIENAQRGLRPGLRGRMVIDLSEPASNATSARSIQSTAATSTESVEAK